MIFALALLPIGNIAAEEVDTLKIVDVEEVLIIAAPKENRKLRELPNAVTLLSQQDMQAAQVNSIKNLTALVPNIFIPDYGSRLTSAVYIRGIGSRINTPSVGLYVDNIPYIDKSAFDFNYSDIERIDVLRGPQGTLYGRNAMGGIIKVHTKSPFSYQGTDFRIGAGTHNQYNTSVTHYHRMNERFAFSAGGFYDYDGGFFRNAARNNDKIDKGQSAGGRMRAIYLPSDNWKLDFNVSYEYSDEIEKDKVISQSIKKGTELKDNDIIIVVISKGKIDKDKLASDGINELGKVPIMMYHGIREKTSNSTGTVGGNVDKDGYNRTPESFRKDLEFYYEKGYRMIRLDDYINGKVDVEYGKSPIILTFDDGNEDNIKVTGLDDNGNIIIDKNSAVGILEEFKKKHPDANVTATFFVNGGIFNQSEYNEKILKWMVDNGYDIGNHTQTHLDIKKSSGDRVQKEIAYVYDKLEELIPGKYVKIIALPFGSPYTKTHDNFKYVLSTTYNGKTYDTEAALRVGWEPEVSCFDKDFDKTFLKRCRAYDNNGKEFDIEMVFTNLEKNRYISDGDPNTITIKESDKDKLVETNKKVITY